MQEQETNNTQAGNTGAGELDAGSFGGGNEGTQSISEDAEGRRDRLGAGETGGGVGSLKGEDDLGRTGTGSAMTGQTDVLGEEGNSGDAAGSF